VYRPLDCEDAASIVTRLRAAGVEVERAPQEAVMLFVEAHQPERDYPELRARGRRSRMR